MIAKFSCACGHHWHVDLATMGRTIAFDCPSCRGKINEPMLRAAVPVPPASELEALRSLRDLVLQLEGSPEFDRGSEAWAAVQLAARAAMTPNYTTQPRSIPPCGGSPVGWCFVCATYHDKCEITGCPHPPEPNLKRCRGHEGGFEILI